MVFWTPYPWYIEPPTYDSLTSLSMVFWPPYPWYFVPLHMVCRSPYYGMLTPYIWYIVPPTHCIWPPTHGILTPLPMVYWTPYLWYFDPLSMVPPIHGILTPLPMVFRGGQFTMRGSKYNDGISTPGSIYHENWPQGQNTIWHRSSNPRPVKLCSDQYIF